MRQPPTEAEETGTDTSPSFVLDRTSFEYLVAEPALCDVEQIRVAVDRADFDDAAVRALARAKLGLALPPEILADLLVGVERMEVFLALARQATGDVLLGLLDCGRFAEDEATGVDQMSYTAFALWKLLAPDAARPLLLSRLRRIARRPQLSLRSGGLVAWLVTQLDDPHLRALYEKHHGAIPGQLAETVGQILSEFWNATLDGIVAMLPEKAIVPVVTGRPERALPRPGRNEACPCGSGQKYKRCCADKTMPPASPSARAARAERLRLVETKFDTKEIDQLSRAELAQLDLRRLQVHAVIAVIRRQARLRDWRRSILANDEYTRRHGKENADELFQEVIFQALNARQYDVAAQLLAWLDDPKSAPHLELELALATGSPQSLADLEKAARNTIRDPKLFRGSELADVVLRTTPALGILVARGALQTSGQWGGESLLDLIEDARDELQVPPNDPAQQLFDILGGVRKEKVEAALAEAERTRLTQTAAHLQANLDEVTGRLKALEDQAAARERELEVAQRAAAEPDPRASAAQVAAAERERRAQREKRNELQALIREGNEERAALRRQLADATESRSNARVAPPEPARDSDSDAADDEAEELPEGAVHTVRLPRFRTPAADAFDIVPRNIASTAMRVIGGLAAGDATAWRAVKQAKDMPRQVIIARVGIHYRLLLRTEHGDLEVLDLVARQSLETTLRKMRSA